MKHTLTKQGGYTERFIALFVELPTIIQVQLECYWEVKLKHQLIAFF